MCATATSAFFLAHFRIFQDIRDKRRSRFSLREPLSYLKEKEARQSMSISSNSEAETLNDTALMCDHPRSGSKRHGSYRERLRQIFTSSSPVNCSRSRSRSNHCVGKGEAALTSHGTISKGKRRDPKDVRSVAGPTGRWTMKDYSEVAFSVLEGEDQPNDKMLEVSEKTKKFVQEKCTRIEISPGEVHSENAGYKRPF